MTLGGFYTESYRSNGSKSFCPEGLGDRPIMEKVVQGGYRSSYLKIAGSGKEVEVWEARKTSVEV